MHRRCLLISAGLFIGSGCSPLAHSRLSQKLTIDRYTLDKIRFLTATYPKNCAGEDRVAAISEALLGTPYLANRLIGSATRPEELVVDLRGVDCLSFLEYVTALSQSTSFDSFLLALIHTRYSNETISFPTRRNFFSDWSHERPFLAQDITRSLSSEVITVTKQLNKKSDDSLYLPGVPVKKRCISYLPSPALPSVLPLLKTGDLIGIYSALPGLDVSHTGFSIFRSGQLFFRNASSLQRNRRVVDTPLSEYMHGKIGVVVLRPLRRPCFFKGTSFF